MDITITGTPALIEDFDAYPSKAQKVIVRAINRGIVAARTQIVRDIARDSGLKVGDVRAAIRQTTATTGAPVASLGSRLRRLPLIDFNARGPMPSRGRGNGVSYRMGAGNPRTRLPNAFITRVTRAGEDGAHSGHDGVFVRVTKQRLPIKQLFGPSLGHVFAKYRAAALARGEEMFLTTLDRDLEYQKGKA